MDDPATLDGQPQDGAAPTSPGAGDPPATDEPDAAPGTEPTAAAPGGRPRSRFYLRGRRLRLPRSRGGLFALLLILSGAGLLGVFTTVSLIHWTETADFCGRCHTMNPELQAYEAGPHSDVSCGECHVEPGVAGWVKSKINGTRQLVEVVLGTYPTPIPPPEHADLPLAADTCMHCHDVEREELADLRTRAAFLEDEANTRQFVGLMIRPGSGDVFDVDRGVHWHVVRGLTYWTPDEDAASIDYVEAVQEDGSIVQYIAQDKLVVADDVEPDIAKIKDVEKATDMSCYDCHNRTGHAIPNPRIEVDYQLSTGGIDATLPYVKRQAMEVLWGNYPDDETADAAAEKLRTFYETNYPAIAATKGAQINAAIDQIKVLYRLSATPEMKVTAKTYPDHIGHTDFPGCFRCHDGGHFKVENGVALKEAIPSTCDTCHTFPQIGPAVASLPLGEPPSTHDDGLFVFNHKNVATDLDPGGQSCGECHARDYCVNCHSTGAVLIDHDTMTTNHAQVIRDQGNQSCSYCHQPVYCARCHREPVLPVTSPASADTPGVPDQPSGLAWPLKPHS